MFGKAAPKKCLPRTTKRYQKITRTYRKSGAWGLVLTFCLVTFGKSLRYLLQWFWNTTYMMMVDLRHICMIGVTYIIESWLHIIGKRESMKQGERSDRVWCGSKIAVCGGSKRVIEHRSAVWKAIIDVCLHSTVQQPNGISEAHSAPLCYSSLYCLYSSLYWSVMYLCF